MELAYYPGCSLHSTGKEFDASVRAVLSVLDVDLRELPDWNCCGASSAHSLSESLAISLPARNLAIAQRAGLDVVMPCAACFNRHKTAESVLRSSQAERRQVEQALGTPLDHWVTVRPLLDVLCNVVGMQAVAAKVSRPLAGLRAVGYYGCLLVRPHAVTQFEDPENPVLMNQLLDVVGADVKTWSYATECCGGALSITRPGVAGRLVERLVGHAREAGAETIVTSCPLCQVNLEMRQGHGAERMPVFYISELLGLAFGLRQADRWWGMHLIDPRPVLRSLELTA